MFTIEIEYSTGSSFHTETGQFSRVGWSWDNLEDAQEALARITGHYKAVQNDAKLSPTVKKAPWYAEQPKGYEDLWEYRVKVPDGKGGSTVIDAFWCGYFESMQEARIVLDESVKSRVTF